MGRAIKKYPLYLIVYLSLFLFVGMPIGYTLVTSIFNSDVGKLDLLNVDLFWLLAKSGLISIVIASLSTLIGSILGLFLYKLKMPNSSFFKLVLLIPLFISPYVLAVAWKDISFLFFGNSQLISSVIGYVLVLTIVYTPLSMLIVGSALANIDAQLEEAGLVLTPFKNVLLRIVLPLIKPALVSSLALVFIFSISEFAVPAYLGVKVFTTEIFTQFSAFYNHLLAIMQSVILVLFCVLLLVSERKYIADAPFFAIGNKGTKSSYYPIQHKNLSLAFLFGWFFISVVLPFVVLLVQSFRDGTSEFARAFELLQPTFLTSIGLAFISALVITFIGFVVSYFAHCQGDTFFSRSLSWLLLLVFAMPATILGISLIQFYNRPFLNFIYSSYAIIVIAYVGKFSFIASKLIGNAIKQIPDSLEEAAQVQGIPLVVRLYKIVIPLTLPTLFVVFVISFIFCFGELGMTIMLYPPGAEIMPIKIFTIMANAPQALVSSMTLLVFSITLIIIAGFYLAVKPFQTKNNLS